MRTFDCISLNNEKFTKIYWHARFLTTTHTTLTGFEEITMNLYIF